jgi:hypothetical protein
MKFNIGDHLQEIGSTTHGIVMNLKESSLDRKGFVVSRTKNWYQIKNDELGLVNHWVPENKLELHKQTLRENKLKELGI